MAKIENPMVEVEQGIELNDKDISNILLTCLKNFTKNYAVSLTEASNDDLYKVYKKQFDSLSSLQRETFELIFKNGWYTLEEADSSKVGEQYNKLNQYYLDLEKTEEK